MKVYENALRALNFQDIERVPVVFPMVGTIYSRLAGVPDNEYYLDPSKMLEAQLSFYEKLPGVFTFPGLWPDFGAMAELGGMGAKISFPVDAPPYMEKPILNSVEEISSFEPGDPRKAEFTARVLDYLKYFNKNVPTSIREEYGLVDGCLFCGGPGEISALILGYEKFFYGVYDHPELIHELLRKVTSFVIEYLKAQIEIVGPPRGIYLWDHLPGMLNRQVYSEFIHPYLHEVFTFVNGAQIKFYHNENNYPHLMDIVRDLPCNLCHIGPKHDLAETKRVLDKCLMGNLYPIEDVLYASDHEIIERCKMMIKAAGKGGGLWLSSGGGLAPDTTLERLKLIVEVANETLV